VTWTCASCGRGYAEPPTRCPECRGIAFDPAGQGDRGTDWLDVTTRVLFSLATLFWALGGSIFVYQRLIA